MAGGSQPCRLSTTTEKLVGREDEFTTDVTVELPTLSVGIFQSLKPIPHKTSQRAVERAVSSETEIRTAPESEGGGCASLFPWNINTLAVLVILPVTLGGAVFVALIAGNYIVKRCKVHRTQHDIQERNNHNAGFFSEVPLLNPQLTTDQRKQRASYANRSSCGIGGTEYHVYELID